MGYSKRAYDTAVNVTVGDVTVVFCEEHCAVFWRIIEEQKWKMNKTI